MSSTGKRVLIIGYGTVGRNLATELSCLNPDICDKNKEIRPKGESYDFGFVCVDTPLCEGKLDVTEVRNAVSDNDCAVYVIKSTVPVGTVDDLSSQTGKRIVFSPEYYGGTQHCNNYEFDFTILGGEASACREVQQLLQDVYDGRHRFAIAESKTAEMAKLMENSWLAYKVGFCIDFWEACGAYGVPYEDLRELFLLDPRVNPSHTFVYDSHPFWESHCLDKDVPAAARQLNLKSVARAIEINESRKHENRSSNP